MERLQGFWFDGAGNMSGQISGVQAHLRHWLNLVLQEEAASNMSLIANALNFVKDISNLIRESAKRKALYRSMFGEKEPVLR